MITISLFAVFILCMPLIDKAVNRLFPNVKQPKQSIAEKTRNAITSRW